MLSNAGTFLSHAEKWAHEYAMEKARKNMEEGSGMAVVIYMSTVAPNALFDVTTDYLFNLVHSLIADNPLHRI